MYVKRFDLNKGDENKEREKETEEHWSHKNQLLLLMVPLLLFLSGEKKQRDRKWYHQYTAYNSNGALE